MTSKHRIHIVFVPIFIASLLLFGIFMTWQPLKSASINNSTTNQVIQEGTIEWAGGYTSPFMHKPFRVNSNPANGGARLDHDSIGFTNGSMSGTYRDGDHYSSAANASDYCSGYSGTYKTDTSPCMSYDRHSGYDYPMSKGTDIYPVFTGTLTYHGGTNDPNAYAEVRHDLDGDGIAEYVTWYVHVSKRIAPDGVVGINDIIAESGCVSYTPCKSAHLHLTVRRNVALPNGTYTERYTDPYGWWNNETEDPLINVDNGVESQWLWIDECPYTDNDSPFCDVQETASLFGFVNLLSESNTTNGCANYGDAHFFCPDHSIPREQAAKFVRQAAGFATDTSCGDFNDVDSSNSFYEDITTLKCMGIVNGVNGSFSPKNYVTRGELAKMVANSIPELTNETPPSGPTSYDDVTSSTTFSTEIAYLSQWGIVNGNDGNFYPDNYVTRAEAAKYVAGCHSLLHLSGSDLYADKCNESAASNAFQQLGTNVVNGVFQNTFPNATRSLTSQNSSPYWLAMTNGVGLYYPYATGIFEYTVADGLPSNSIASIGISPDDTIWAGTDAGIASFDGTVWTTYSQVNTPVNDVTISSLGIVWMATETGLVKYNGIDWTTYTTSDGLPSDNFLAISTDENDWIWGITTNQEFGYFDNTTWTPIDVSALSTINTIDMQAGVVMLGTANGVFVYENGEFADIPLSSPLNIKSISHAPDGKFWIIADNGKVGVYDNGWVVPLLESFTPPNPIDILNHLNQQKRLHQITDSPDYAPGTFVAPDSDWQGSSPIAEGDYTINQSHALHMQNVAIYRTSVQDEFGQDIAWETVNFADIIELEWNHTLPYTLLDDSGINAADLADVDILVIPSFTNAHIAEVEAALGSDGMDALAAFVRDGGTVYAQGQAQALLESAGILPTGTVDVNSPLHLPGSTNIGELTVLQPNHPLSFNWESDQLYLLDDPTLTVPDGFQTIAEYNNTIGGTQPAIVYGEVGDGEVILVNGHPTAPNHPNQRMILFNGLLMGMAERGELHGRAIQTYDGNVPDNLIPAYEDNLPISVTLHFDNLWQGITLTDTIIEERVQVGFEVITASITPPTKDVTITVTDGMTETIIRWDIGDAPFGRETFQYIATTDVDSLATGRVVFSTGSASYDDGQAASWAHPDFILLSAMPANLVGEHDNEPDRYFTIPEEGLYIDEFIYLENKEFGSAFNVYAMRYIPLIVPIVGLEDQREPLTTNAGETVWMKNTLFAYDDISRYPLPIGMNQYTETWGLEAWDGVTVVTMTTPGGYHIDPLPARSPSPGFFVTIPPTYTHMITVTEDFELLLPAMQVEWEIADEFPGYHYEMPSIRYGIHATELFSRPVSFTGDPFVDTVVVDATGGSIYTGSGSDPRAGYRDYLADVGIYPPTPPITTGLTYQDVWSRTHEIPIRANFVDVFNFASCGGCGGNSERHAMLNVTYGIWADMDGDGTGDTLLTDFDEMKGVMPTNLTGDMVILIKSRNLGTTIGANENVIDGRIFRGLGYTITPSDITWAESYTSTYSTLITETRDGGYDQLIFQQDIPINATDLITINAKFDSTANSVEGMMKLHDGARFVYRQQFAGPGQYEVNDTHIQSVIGVRSDLELDSYAIPAAVSTYEDTLFVQYDLYDKKDWIRFDLDPYLESWGYGRLSATTYVGGRDKMELLHSIVSLGDRTWLRVEIDNNDGYTLTDVELFPIVPDGITATAVFSDINNLPVPMWPDLPFLHLQDIPDTTYGIYYFELQVSETATELQGQVLDIPFAFSAGNAPAGFEIPPAKLAIRDADGSTPSYISGVTENIVLTDTLESTIDVVGMRLMTDDEVTTLRQRIISDTSVIPNTHYADAYWESITATVPYTVENRLLTAISPVELPWLPDGESAIHLVAYETISTTRAVRQPINNNTGVDGVDSFSTVLTDTVPRLYVDARGSSIRTTIVTKTITNTQSGTVIPVMYANEQHEVVLEITASNWGNDVAVDTLITVTLGNNFTPTVYPSRTVTLIPGGLVWNARDLAPGTSHTVEVIFNVYAEPDSQRVANAVGAEEITAVSQSNGAFINAYSGAEVTARTGGAFIMPLVSRSPIVWQTFLPTIMHNAISAPDLVVTAVNVTPNQATITIENQGNATANAGCIVNDTCFWVDLYISPNPAPTQVNQIWDHIASSGAAWEITRPLAPGEELTLTLHGTYYSAKRSIPSLPFAIGARAYAQVDSFNLDTTYGTVNENHEIRGNAYNNILGPVTVTQE